VERGFSPKGRPPILPVETKRQRVNMISAVSSQGKARFMIYQDTMNQRRLIRFMERLVRGSKRKVFLILDNLKVHHGKLAAVWLKKRKDKIEVFFLPPYVPEYNPDEYLNHALKISVHSGQCLTLQKTSPIRCSPSCAFCSIIPLMFPISSCTPRFPTFYCGSNTTNQLINIGKNRLDRHIIFLPNKI